MPDRASTQLNPQIEEIRLIKYALLPGEVLVFLDYYDSKLWFEVELPDAYPDDAATPLVSIKGEGITRHEQDTNNLYLNIVASPPKIKKKSEVEDQSTPSSGSNGVMGQWSASGPGPEDHRSGYLSSRRVPRLTNPALPNTPHHQTERRNLQQSSSPLSVSGSGSAEVGYPGVILCVRRAGRMRGSLWGNVKASGDAAACAGSALLWRRCLLVRAAKTRMRDGASYDMVQVLQALVMRATAEARDLLPAAIIPPGGG
ncbi:hypothetical protein BDN71DRAFT_1589591 [Pleurotus eryngii]|uniref:Uncharacterized protein n=1 Tax=Pleurotus eryngii TaxID=5323 RepID=A0A9P5ZW96_PLEER|nr:hypothetical protein BDN71DRAFT_1589591 [Pleurotus eryngii]